MKNKTAKISPKTLTESKLRKAFSDFFSVNISNISIEKNVGKKSTTFSVKNTENFSEKICEIIGCESGRKQATKTAEEWSRIFESRVGEKDEVGEVESRVGELLKSFKQKFNNWDDLTKEKIEKVFYKYKKKIEDKDKDAIRFIESGGAYAYLFEEITKLKLPKNTKATKQEFDGVIDSWFGEREETPKKEIATPKDEPNLDFYEKQELEKFIVDDKNSFRGTLKEYIEWYIKKGYTEIVRTNNKKFPYDLENPTEGTSIKITRLLKKYAEWYIKAQAQPEVEAKVAPQPETPKEKEHWQMTFEELKNTVNIYRGIAFVSFKAKTYFQIYNNKSQNKSLCYRKIGKDYHKKYKFYAIKSNETGCLFDTEIEAITALKRYHRQEIQQAISEGKTVPTEVLAEYPDLRVGEVEVASNHFDYLPEVEQPEGFIVNITPAQERVKPIKPIYEEYLLRINHALDAVDLELHEIITSLHDEILHHPEVKSKLAYIDLDKFATTETTGFFMGKYEPSLEWEINTGDKCEDWKALYRCASFAADFSQDSYLVSRVVEIKDDYEILGKVEGSGEFKGFQYVLELLFTYEVNLEQYYQALAIYQKYENQIKGFTVYSFLQNISPQNEENSKQIANFKLLFFRDLNSEKDAREQFKEYFKGVGQIQRELQENNISAGRNFSKGGEANVEQRTILLKFFEGEPYGEGRLRDYTEVKAHIGQVLTDLGCEDLPIAVSKEQILDSVIKIALQSKNEEDFYRLLQVFHGARYDANSDAFLDIFGAKKENSAEWNKAKIIKFYHSDTIKQARKAKKEDKIQTEKEYQEIKSQIFLENIIRQANKAAQSDENPHLRDALLTLLKEKANSMTFDDFANGYYVPTFILEKGNRETGKEIPELLGLKPNADVLQIYQKLRTNSDFLKHPNADITFNKQGETYQDESGNTFDQSQFEETVKKEVRSGKKVAVAENEGKGGDYSTSKGLDQYFTPSWICELMWDIAFLHGFKENGTVFEPSVGNGRFLEFAPKQANVTGFEIDNEALSEAKAKYPKANLFNQYFETAFLKPPRFNTPYKPNETLWLEGYPFDLVIGNPPYGKHTNMFQSYFSGLKIAQLEHFFLVKSIDLLKVGGLCVMIIPTNFLRNGETYTPIKDELFSKAELIDAYRLPQGTFANTDIATDIIVLKRK